jgi:hypothetical protein
VEAFAPEQWEKLWRPRPTAARSGKVPAALPPAHGAQPAHSTGRPVQQPCHGGCDAASGPYGPRKAPPCRPTGCDRRGREEALPLPEIAEHPASRPAPSRRGHSPRPFRLWLSGSRGVSPRRLTGARRSCRPCPDRHISAGLAALSCRRDLQNFLSSLHATTLARSRMGNARPTAGWGDRGRAMGE